MSSSDPATALLLGTGAGVWFFFKGFRIFREYKLIADTPRISIRSVAMGFIHIRGKAESERLVSSPVSCTPCCFYRVIIEQWHTKGHSGEWRHFCTDANGYQFYLADETGKVLVDAHSAEYDLPESAQCTVNSESSSIEGVSVAPTADLLQYITSARTRGMTDRLSHWIDTGFEKAGAADNPQMQAQRDVLRELLQAVPTAAKGGQPNFAALEKLAAAGGPLADPQKEQQRQAFLERLHQAETGQQTGQLSIQMPESTPAIGRYRLCEYLVLPGQEYQVSGTCMQNPSPSDSLERSIIMKGDNEPTFMISASSDAGISSALRAKAFFSVVGGAALTLVCLALLLLHWKLF